MRSNLIPALMPYDPYKDWLLALDFANLVNSPNGKPTFKTPYGIYDKFSSIPGASFSAGEIIFYNPITGLWNFRAANDDTPTQGVGLDIPEGTTNKCTNYNAAPPVLVSMMGSAAFNAAAAAATGMSATGGDAGSLWGVVDDTSELRNSGLGPLLDAGKLNGRVYKIDNTAGGAIAALGPNGLAGNTNPHSMSAFVRGSGKGQVRISGSPITATDLTRQYVRRSITQTPIDTANRNLIFTVDPGAVSYIILNQLEEKAYATNPVIVAGASASRGAATPVVTGLASILTPPFTLVAVANLSAIDGQNRYLVAASAAGSSNERVRIYRDVVNNGIAGTQAGGAGTTVQTAGGKSGPRLLKAAIRVRSALARSAFDGVSGPDTAITNPTGLDRLDLGVANGALSGFLNSPLLFAGIAPDLTDAELQALTA